VPRARDYLKILAGGWLVIVLATLASAGAAYAAQEYLPDRHYQASVLLMSQVAGDPATFAAYAGGMGANARIATYVGLAQSELVAERTVDQVPEAAMTPAQLAAATSATWLPGGVNRFGRPNSALLQVTVTDPEPARAAALVNAQAANLMSLSRELEWIQSAPTDPIQYTGPVAELVPVDAAKSASEVRPPVLKGVVVGAGVGFALSVVLVLLVGITRDTVLTPAQLDHIAKQAMSGNA
jgi:capsular polysaccharide biosynthesis protein